MSLALALAGCGGGSDGASEEPMIPRALAQELAAKSDDIATALAADDVCGAAQLADELKNAVDDALSSGQIPSAFRSELEATATGLQNEVNCPQEPEQPENKGKGKGDKDKEGETTTIITTVPTTTDGEG